MTSTCGCSPRMRKRRRDRGTESACEDEGLRCRAPHPAWLPTLMTSPTADGERHSGRLTALSDGRAYPIPAAGLLIGRHQSCDVVLTSLRVSRRHARVVQSPEGYALLDDSANGGVVNGVRVDGRIVLKQGDIIGVGEAAFRFSSD